MTTIFPHTNNEDKVDYDLIPVGQILLGFKSKNITTKTFKNSVVIVGNSLRKFKDFINYYSYFDGSLIKIKDGELTTVFPNIFLRDISGIQINPAKDYLVVNSSGGLTTENRKEYSVNQLKEVYLPVQIKNKYALTFNGSFWTDLPEASALSRFDDVSYSQISYGVFVSYFEKPNAGGFGNSYRVLPLDISWDKAPNLSSNLNCNSKSIINLNYNSNAFIAEKALSSFTIDTIQYSQANINCNQSVKVLNLQIIPNENHLKYFTLNIQNFMGIINFKSNADLVFENGYLPRISKPNNVYTILTYKDDAKIKLIILHKNRNMSEFTNE